MSGNPSIERRALVGQVAIVTGGGRGIGRAMAQALAAAGAAVAVVARSAEQVAETAAFLHEGSGRGLALSADVTDPQAVEQVMAQTERELGPVDLLVNNAGSAQAIGPIWDVEPDQWWRDVAVNLRGTFLCARAVLPGMLARHRGRIINMSSLFGVLPGVGAALSGYACSKAAVLSFTDGLAASTKPYGISVFAISPGWVNTTMTRHLTGSPAGQQWLPWARTIEAVPPERAGQLVVFLASGQGDALTGRFLHVSDDVAELVQRAEEIQRDDLYTLRLRK